MWLCGSSKRVAMLDGIFVVFVNSLGHGICCTSMCGMNVIELSSVPSNGTHHGQTSDDSFEQRSGKYKLVEEAVEAGRTDYSNIIFEHTKARSPITREVISGHNGNIGSVGLGFYARRSACARGRVRHHRAGSLIAWGYAVLSWQTRERL